MFIVLQLGPLSAVDLDAIHHDLNQTWILTAKRSGHKIDH